MNQPEQTKDLVQPGSQSASATSQSARAPDLRSRSLGGGFFQQIFLVLGALSAATAIVLVLLIIIGLGDRLALIELFWKVVFGTAGLGGVLAALRRADAQDATVALQRDQLEQAEVQRVTDRAAEEQRRFIDRMAEAEHAASVAFAAALDRLSADGRMARVGAIYGLEAIVKDHPEFHWRMVEVVTAFLRSEPLRSEESSRRLRATAAEPDDLVALPHEDVVAAATVLSRRNAALDEGIVRLHKALLHAVSFEGAELSGADLLLAELRAASFRKAKLCRARLVKANLWGANFKRADLTEAMFADSDLQKAMFDGAILDRADFRGATNLTKAQLAKAASAQDVIGAPTV